MGSIINGLIFKVFRLVDRKVSKLISVVRLSEVNARGRITTFGIVNVQNGNNISVGEGLTLNDGVYINGKGGVEIGNNVSISAGAIIVSTGLDPDSLFHSKVHVDGLITIGDNVQIGAGAIILPGVSIGSNVIIGAGAVVTHFSDSNAIYVGVPARLLRNVNGNK